ncbi:MAG: T9SS type A sorting domain-containing protein, partial [Bacteroidales bacterium]|nr:T9SS type A sorting domain-containing protein [Bacteroidales bacterium]
TVIDSTKYKYPYLLSNLNINHPNHVWALDISYIPMKKGHMYMLYGKKLWNENINNSMLSIDMSTYCKGVYFISCKLNNGKTIIRKIIKK